MQRLFQLRNAAAAFLIVSAAGCATSPLSASTTAPLAVPLPASAPITIQDARPEIDRQSSIRVVADTVYTTLGDDAFTPTAASIVGTWLGGANEAKLRGRSIVLRRFHIEVSDEGGRVDESRFSSTATQTPGASATSIVAARFLVGEIQSLISRKIISAYVVVEIDGVTVEDSNAATYKGRVGGVEVIGTLTKTLAGIAGKVGAR